jgi:hypothetical protein
MSALRDHLQKMSQAWRSLKASPGAWLTAEFLLHKGVDCQAQALPKRYSRMIPKQCFRNAAQLVQRRKGLQYCEGYFLRPDIGIPIHHAWAIDQENRVIDPTLDDPEAGEFIGYPMALAMRKQWISKHSYSVLDTGRGINIKFMIHECSDLLDLIDNDHREFVMKTLASNG